MPLVFVHGVNVRREPGNEQQYDQGVAVRDAYFREIAFEGIVSDAKKMRVGNPYWGGLAAKFHWNQSFLTKDIGESFGPGDLAREAVVGETAPDLIGATMKEDQFLTVLARKSLARAVDCLFGLAAVTPSDSQEEIALAKFGSKANHYAEQFPNPDWLSTVKNDEDFAEKLMAEVGKWSPTPGVSETFGPAEIWDRVKRAAATAGQAAKDLSRKAAESIKVAAKKAGGAIQGAVTTAGSAVAGAALNPFATSLPEQFYQRFGLFLGDVFKYLQTRGTVGNEGPIVKVVADAFRDADKMRKATNEQLVILGHSMGGNIAYDILTHYLPDLQCDLFLTVGSQVGLFEELKLFHSSDTKVSSPSVVQMPANIKRWLNVYDPIDVFGYSLTGIFAGPKDLVFSNETDLFGAHTMYFFRPRFHNRFNVRLREGLQ
jgi:hypothetical protein